MITLVALDIAGTTVEEHQTVYSVLADTVAATGAVIAPDAVHAWMGADKRAALRGLLTDAGRSPDEDDVAAAYGDFRRRLHDAYRAMPPTPIPGVPEALRELRAHGVRVALTTGFDHEVTDLVLSAVGWDDSIVDAVVCAEDVGGGRPAPYMIFRAMELTGTTSVAEVLVAGDTVLDLRAGANAGAARIVGVLTGGHDRMTLEQAPHTEIIASLANITDLVGVH